MRLLSAIACALVLSLPAQASEASAPGIIETRTGAVQGVAEGGSVVYRGLPYALPPVGDLRWRGPQPVRPWQGVRVADQFGPDCMQIPYKADAAPLGVKPSEDCLYINVWTPTGSALGKRPVMVWIYGGGFVNGGSSPPVYSGRAFAESGVVFVSFNYRLGRFGFFAHPALTREAAEAPTGNYAILDQIAALRWVRDNIASFGGDPDNVTIFGESAGGMSVHTLATTSLAKGLFHKAIVMSGGGRDLMGPQRTAAEAEAIGVGFAQENGIAGDGSEALAALRTLPADSVMSGLNLMTLFDAKDFTPLYADGQVVRRPIDAAYAGGDGVVIPMVIGANDADGFFFGGGLEEAYAPLGAARRAEAESLYDPEGRGDPMRIGVAISADTMFIEPARHVARIISERGQPVFTYRFGYVPEYLRTKVPGAFHASELPFVFATVEARHGDNTTPADRAAARKIHDYWVGFARSGVPSSAGAPWSQYDAAADRVMIFDAAGAHEEPDPIRARLDFVEQITEAKAP